jgi:superfamily II DNA or RNA helicase
MAFAVGSLVHARGRDWVVLPDTTDEIVRAKPLGGTDIETTSILIGPEKVENAQFNTPAPEQTGDLRSATMLRDAVRIGFRTSTGPFRSFASISVEPRPYQIVPLLMALRQNPVRLLIGDDVGIGKTVESALIAKEMISRGEADRLCVLCPPHLAEQWRVELESKFNISAVLVLPSTVSKLERQCMRGTSVFEQFPYTIVSLDYIKAERRRDDFLRACPNLIIVDEAHTCTLSGHGSQQQRYRLLKELASVPTRHVILVTATPHSGNEHAFRSLLALINPDFENLPDDLGGEQNRRHREQLASYFVQRRRGDIKAYLNEDTPFPEREERDCTYKLHEEYKAILNLAMKYAREIILDKSGTIYQQRIRWWSALALLRSISSSPAAAIATLKSRSSIADSLSEEAIEELGKLGVMDVAESIDTADNAPGADYESLSEETTSTRRRFSELAKRAESLKGAKDHKLIALVEQVKILLRDGFSPIVFCRYIPTAEYIAAELQARLKDTEVACVTGQLAHDAREERVLQLASSEKPRRVLVCTDCLSEGINLQDYFDAVIHADLAWSPTRHEQREGRIDRFNQKSPMVRIVNFFGEDNPIDGIVLKVLLRKHKEIRSSLGISVPVPIDSDKILEAIFEALLLRGDNNTSQLSLFDGDAALEKPRELADTWQKVADREKRSRTLFAQNAIKPDEVKPEIAAMRSALGAVKDIELFTRNAIRAHGGEITKGDVFVVNLDLTPQALRDAVRYEKPFKATFRMPSPRRAMLLSRTHPFVEALATYVMDASLAGDERAAAKRCAVTETKDVTETTTVLLLRNRFQIISSEKEMFAEDCCVAAFSGDPRSPRWIEDVEPLLTPTPSGNIEPDRAKQILRMMLSQFDALQADLNRIAKERAQAVLDSHRRVRKAVNNAATARDVKVQGEPDILGVYILVPAKGNEQ